MTVESNKAVVRAIYDALAHGDRSVFTSKASWSNRYEGQAEIRARLLGPLFNRFAGTYTARLINLIAEGNTVVAELEGDVETKAGVRYDNQYCMLFHFCDGKISEIVEYCDTDLEERALGKYEDALAEYEALSS
jgi:uncharacterized protein